jgi:hypothetical protein
VSWVEKFSNFDFCALSSFPLLRPASKDASILGLPFIGGWSLFILLAFILALSALPAHAAGSAESVFGKIDLAFERNEGQFDPSVKFLARSPGYSVFVTANETVMRVGTEKPSVIRMKFLNQHRNSPIDGLELLPGRMNYLLRDGTSHKTNIRSYKRVRESDVYPGIDLEYHGNNGQLEYDFIVKPGSNPGNIRMSLAGIRGVSVDSSGDLILKTDGDAIVQKKPRAYQLIDGQEQTIAAAYNIRGNIVGFTIGEYDRRRPLIIDPVLVYSTFFGGTGNEVAYGIAVDPQGSVYVTGATASTDFPVQSAVQSAYKGGSTDAFIFKLDPSGSQLVYSTFIGGSATDEAHSIAVDAGGNAYITGFTQSTDFPVVNGFQKTRAGEQEAYVLKLNSSGSGIVFSTYLGGSSDDRGFSIAVDAGTNVYVTGTTASNNFPTANPYQRSNAGGFADAFVTKIGAAGNLVYSTYVGGIGNDNPLGIAVDGSGAAYVTGWTTSVNFPLVNPLQTKFGGLDTPVGTDDIFVFKLTPAGTGLDYSTYIGGTGSDEGTRIAVDSAGSAYITGYTSSLNFPVVKPYQAALGNFEICLTNPASTCLDSFVAKVAPDGKSLVFATYFGGFQNDSGSGIAVDASGSIYVAGYTTSFDFPSANGIQNFIGGDRDAFVAKFAPSGNILVFSTFLGGSGTESATGLTIDATGNVYVVGITNSGDFKTQNPAQAAVAGAQEVFVSKLDVADIVSTSLFQVAPQGASSVVTKGTRTDPVFGYAVAEPIAAGTQLTGLEIINREQNGASVSEVGIPAPPFTQTGRLFVDVSATDRSVLSIANPNDLDATVDFFYTDQTGTTTQFATATVKAHEHFSKFVTDDPLNIFAPGTLNFTSSLPVAATAFFTQTNESGELLIGHTPIVDPVPYSVEVGNKTIAIPELLEGGGWRSDVILVNPSEDRMNGEVRFFSQGNGDQPGAPMEVGIGDENIPASAVEFDIPPRGFQKVSTAGGATSSETPFALTRGTSVATPGSGPFQVSGWASADSANATDRLNGLELIEYRQLGVTQTQTGVLAPPPRQTGRFFAELSDTVRTFMAIANPNDQDVAVDVFLTDENGTSTDPVTITVAAGGQSAAFLSDAPVSLPTKTKRTVNFNASLPVFVTALRFFTNERSDSILSAIPIADNVTDVDQSVVIPHFADGAGWRTRIVLVNNTDDELRGELRFLSPGSLTAAPQPVVVGTDLGDASVFEYHIQPRSYFQLQTNGAAPDLSTGSVQIVPFQGFRAPAAHGVLADLVVDEVASAAAGDIRSNTIFEASVEAQQPAASLRFYAEAVGDFDSVKPRSTRTVLAIANPTSAPQTVQLEVTSFEDVRLGLSSPLTIPPNGQFAGYLFQVPGLEALPVPFKGVVRLSVLSGTGVTGASFRILRNERLDYLVTTTGPLNENAGMPGRLIFPYMSDSTGYTTNFILINPPAAERQISSGVLRFWATDGSALQLDTLRLGSVQIVPFGGFNTPHAYVALLHRDAGVLTSIIGVEGQLPARTFRMYAESLGDFESGTAGTTRSSLALANPSESPATVTLEIRTLDGTLLRTSQPLQVPANGQVALFLNQVPGFETVPQPFEGVLRVISTSPQGVTATAFRSINNERGSILYTTTGPLSEDAGSAEQLVFPHIAEGGGYTTQFIVIGGASGQGNAGVLRFFNQEGNPLNLTLTTR